MWHSNPDGVPRGIALEPVSMGKGFVQWRVVYPTLVKKNRQLAARYDRLEDACAALGQYCRREELDPYTVEQIEAQLREAGRPAPTWGANAEA